MPKARVREGAEPVVSATFNLPPAYLEAFDAEAASRDVSRSELLRRMIENTKAIAARLEALGVAAKAASGAVADFNQTNAWPSGYRKNVHDLKPPKKAT